MGGNCLTLNGSWYNGSYLFYFVNKGVKLYVLLQSSFKLIPTEKLFKDVEMSVHLLYITAYSY